MKICLVTPFAWSLPHDVNQHVAGIAKELRALGHSVTVIAPSGRPADLAAGRRALARGDDAETIAIGTAVPVSRRSSLGVPVGVRANLRLALQQGRFDVVHGFEPGLPSISYLALRDSEALGVASFFSPDRLGYPPRRALREKLLARIDALIASSETTAAAAAERFPGDYRIVSPGVDTELFRPGASASSSRSSCHSGSLPVARAALRSLRELPGWEAVLLRTKPLSTRPGSRSRSATACASAPAAGPRRARPCSPRPPSSSRLRRAPRGFDSRLPPPALRSPLRRACSSSPSSRPRRSSGWRRTRSCASGRGGRREQRPSRRASPRSRTSSSTSTAASAGAGGYGAATATRSPTGRGSSPTCTCTPRWSHDCSIEVDELLPHAEAEGLGAIAVTDHNVFGGALEAVEKARGRELIVIPGEEVKTDDQGEVIGLFLKEEIPRGMSFAETVAAIREQEGIVYLPHPFDRMHAIPFPATLHRHLHEIDVLEVYNARLLFEGYNDEAVRFARKYGLPAGAGSDAHVLQGVGTGALRMRAFDGPEEFMLSLRTAEVLRRPKSLAYLQSLKWVAQVKEKVR